MNVLDMVATVSLDSTGYNAEMDKMSGKASKVMGTIKKFVAGAAIGAAVVKTAKAATSLVSSAVDAYGNYEQLVGGVETLFGAQGMSLEEYAKSVGKSVSEAKAQYEQLGAAQDIVMANAANAYKTAGLSANAYMEQATSTAASLVSSLGGDTKKAAEMADMAIVDMSDNANKMGTSIENIQNAYGGFAKGNFTMLDNLKLGYGGTKEEMERLLEDAEKIKASQGEVADYSIDSYADIVEAIHTVQDEMGIAGTTAKEASTTIQGSLGMVKAAWENVLTAMGEGDTDKLFENMKALTDSVKTFLDNLVPVIVKSLDGIAMLVGHTISALAEQLPELLGALLPAIISMVEEVLSVITELMPDIVSIIVENLPMLLDAGMSIILALINGLAYAMPDLIPAMIEAVVSMVYVILDNLPLFIDAAVDLIIGLAEGLMEALPILLETAPQIIERLTSELIGNAEMLISAALQVVMVLVDGVVRNLPLVIQAAIQIIASLVSGIAKSLPKIVEAAGSLIRTFIDTVGKIKWGDIGKNILRGIANGIRNGISIIKDAIHAMATDAFESAKNFFGIHSPSTLFEKFIGWMLPRGTAKGIEEETPTAVSAIEDMADKLFLGLPDGSFTTEVQTVPLLDETSNVGIGDYRTASPANVTINVYATERQDERKIAEEVQKQFIIWERQRKAVFA